MDQALSRNCALLDHFVRPMVDRKTSVLPFFVRGIENAPPAENTPIAAQKPVPMVGSEV